QNSADRSPPVSISSHGPCLKSVGVRRNSSWRNSSDEDASASTCRRRCGCAAPWVNGRVRRAASIALVLETVGPGQNSPDLAEQRRQESAGQHQQPRAVLEERGRAKELVLAKQFRRGRVGVDLPPALRLRGTLGKWTSQTGREHCVGA